MGTTSSDALRQGGLCGWEDMGQGEYGRTVSQRVGKGPDQQNLLGYYRLWLLLRVRKSLKAFEQNTEHNLIDQH